MTSILEGAYDIHVHCNPDVVTRVEDVKALAEAADAAGMAGIVLKDHTTNTTGRSYTLNVFRERGVRFYSALALNIPVGGVNPVAVKAALLAGAAMVYFPTYCAGHHIGILGLGNAPKGMPLAEDPDFKGYWILDAAGELTPEAKEIVALIAEHDAVLATGHISPKESLALLAHARDAGVRRMVVTHASESVPGMSVEEQKACIELGAWIEHCFLAVSECCPGNIPMSAIADQIRATGHERVILSSDFGQIPNGPIVPAYEKHLEKLEAEGIEREMVRRMIVDNPRDLLAGIESRA